MKLKELFKRSGRCALALSFVNAGLVVFFLDREKLKFSKKFGLGVLETPESLVLESAHISVPNSEFLGYERIARNGRNILPMLLFTAYGAIDYPVITLLLTAAETARILYDARVFELKEAEKIVEKVPPFAPKFVTIASIVAYSLLRKRVL